MISEDGGRYLLALSRETLHLFLRHKRVMDVPRKIPAELDQCAGVLVEVYKHVPGTGAKELRGSAAVLDASKPLADNVIAASLAAINDRRFAGMRLDELPVSNIELSVIGGMEDITSREAKDYLRRIRLGADGLYMEKGIMKGILMPNVPIERKWTVRESLENLCLKSGLLKDGWADPAARIYRFSPQAFKEK
jgi:uncharacterized protein (TIGR00296 family)